MEQPDREIGTRKDLCFYRIQTAKENLKSARILLAAKEYKSSNNRAYYAIFHAINAVHALNGKSYKRHKDAVGNFNKDYVKTDIFPREIGRKISEAAGKQALKNIYTKAEKIKISAVKSKAFEKEGIEKIVFLITCSLPVMREIKNDLNITGRKRSLY